MNPVSPLTARPRHAVLLFVTSASVLAHEILLMRTLSYALWHHLASMVISMALLGFGAAGSLLFLTQNRIRRNPDAFLAGSAACTAFAYPLSLVLFRTARLDPLALVWRAEAWENLACAYLALALPFFFAGAIVGIILSNAGEKTPPMVGVDLLGAGCGALSVVPALYLAAPWQLVPLLGALTLLAGLPCARAVRRSSRAISGLGISAGLLFATVLALPLAPDVHEAKGLPQILALPDARVEAARQGPLGLIHVVGSRHIHQVPGLSLHYGADRGESLPEQKGLFVDGTGPSPMMRFTGDPGERVHLDYTPPALAYHIRRPERVLVVGLGGGADVQLALHHSAKRIHALDPDPHVVSLLAGPFGAYAGGIFALPGVRLLVDEPRRYLRDTRTTYDLIQISSAGFGGAGTGAHYAAAEDYLRTTEAFECCLNRLDRQGMLALSCWLQIPPRDSLRLTATALEALRRSGSSDPASGLLVIRSWATATILASPSPFTQREIRHAQAFCQKRGFDTAFFPGMATAQASRFDKPARPWYYQGISRLAGPESHAFLEDYVYDVSPTTDDRPYFSRFFRWDRALELFRHFHREWLPRVESGYFFLLAALIQALVAGGVLILLPLVFLRCRRPTWGGKRGAPGVLFLYFACPGLGFMFFEMALLPKYTLILAHPVIAASAVLSTMLVFAGLGSLSLYRLNRPPPRLLWLGVLVVTSWFVALAVAGTPVFDAALTWGEAGRWAFAAATLAVPAFFLGWPFPLGLRQVSETHPRLVPWAWGVNACASVVGAILGKCLAMSFGLKGVMMAGLALYLLAASLFPRLNGGVEPEEDRRLSGPPDVLSPL